MPASDRFLDTVYARSSSTPILTLLEADLDGEMKYYVNDNQSTTSSVSGSSQVYQPAGFAIALPEDTAEGTPTATLDFDAGDIQMVRDLRAANSRIILRLWVVLSDDPNVIEFGPAVYESTDFSVSGTAVSVTLEVEPILNVQVPGLRYTPQVFPALWNNRR